MLSYWEVALTTITTLSIFLIVYVKWAQSYWARKNVVTIKPSFFFGNSKSVFFQEECFGDNLRSFYAKIKEKRARHCGYYMFLNPVWMVLDLDLIKDVLTKDFQYFMDRCIYMNEKNDPLTGQIFMLKGAKWKNLRGKCTPMFSSGKIKAAVPLLTNCSEQLVNIMDRELDKKVINIKDIAARYTTDVIGSYAFGINCNSLKNPDSEFRVFGRMALELNILQSVKQFIAFNFPWIMDALKLPLFPQKVIDFFLNLVKETVTYREKNKIIRNDFLQQLLVLKQTDNAIHQRNATQLLTLEEISAQAFVFFLGGFETASTTLGFCIYELVQNQHIQERLRCEVQDVCKKYNGELSYDSLNNMVYLNCCIEETLRKYPPIPFILRQCTQNYKVPGSDVEITKGTRVFIPILGIMHDPEYFPEPDVFNPDRFTSENKQFRHPFAWLPFGEGPRICIGARFGMLQMKMLLATLIMNYKLSLNEKTVTPLVMNTKNFMLSVNGDIWLNFEKAA